MRRPWKEYTAPNGKKYYYNSETKKTQWERPIFESRVKDDVVPVNRNPQGSSALDKINIPVYVIPLSNDWKLVIWNNGTKFYIDPHGKSQKGLEDPDSLELLDYINRDKLILLVGFARGYMSSHIDPDVVYDEILEEIEQMKQDLNGDKGSESNDDIELVLKDNKDANEPVNEEELELQRQLITNLNDVDEPNTIGNNTEAKKKFMELLDNFHLDKFSTWRIEMKKIESQQSFFLIESNNEREQLFEEWCSNFQTVNSDNYEDGLESDSSMDESDGDELEPTKYHYLSHIINKTDITNDTIYQDVRKQQKSLFKEFKIKEFITSKKEQEQFTSKLLFYYKNFDLEERKKLFVHLINTYKVQLSYSLQHSLDTDDKVGLLSETQFRTLLEENNSFEIETTLLRLEQLINVQGLLNKLIEEPIYYVLGIKDKTVELFNILNHLMSIP
ncbi:similar to Saccharomyces cerevisiae YPR152C URN1 Putative protein of unknown function containing WW and FF domains [Maudiozyma barnettii]|uniref:WW domain-containing protein n=1 Tax=Maudiozyma barnettii TaxID=61262 RepID=A0A8H2VAS4_9SACH|nr:Urn1p [Kazachstania barnettii]CAB4251857.1 similar to Saccharomyces cerevisiae YPR152C URN1 Putative protein of unknown function containing WW and FF domains [Kazachstania barnettii]CAD1778135.1 similar to Saccharomyces cerevisiae YPR152C URN1 Putative protein of unknown function containing WW and FF domains [Kazachstania barnettii]